MTLKDCTKEELIFIISQLKIHCGSSGEYYVTRVLSALELDREEKKLEKARQWADRADQKRREHIAILSPYDGMRWVDIPADVLERADAAMKEAQAADRAWNKIMGLEPK